MKLLKTDDIRLKFLLNSTIPIEGIGEFKAPLLKNVVDLTEDTYNLALSSFLFSRKSLEVSPEQIKDISDFDLLRSVIYHDISFREMFFCAFELHFGKPPLLHEEGLIYFDELSEDSVLTEEKFDYIKRLAMIANNLQESEEEEEEEVYASELGRKFAEEQKRKKAALAKYKKPKMNLHSIISAVGWKAQGFDFINQLNIYQLYDGYSRFQVLDNFNFTMSGIYAGTVDSSKIKLEDINWANISNK